ncbi:hypothetical protein RO3G_05979 [Rhizopus delemar RA 99-880]|uniref:Uncharacterized protein n=1 Tax=Rhizopus delemar (strain RA 99-880 / ATCC MYA-4621 / FGSC 9543 / NRRL 43880) TaxID=246409 RepID=I1BYJ4_RHIO9|nr:hypothetical protein RO3G_05979 [Rhizopus delemar RA 99-880]|eukprot:EIE81274.1 hypothetical protein RO3G_05979 [Rhizopus delemar RA 99-880]
MPVYIDFDKSTVSNRSTSVLFISLSLDDPIGVEQPTPVSQITKLTLDSVFPTVEVVLFLHNINVSPLGGNVLYCGFWLSV